MKDEITKALQEITGEVEIQLTFPEREEHGDYTTNVALIAAKKQGKNPRELAQEIANSISQVDSLKQFVAKVQVAGPGFINIHLQETYLVSNMANISSDYGKSQSLGGKKYLIEHTSPNTIKTLHVGHARNMILGMAVHNLLESQGAEVKLDSINNDRGIHVMKADWAYLVYGRKDGQIPDSPDWKLLLARWSDQKEEWLTPEDKKLKGDKFADDYYVLGVKAEEDEKVKDQMREMLREWEAGNEKLRDLWKTLRDWTFAGFEDTYKAYGAYHDKEWFESDFYYKGKEIALQGEKKGIFNKLDNGALLSHLEDYKLPDTIILRSDGTTLYHTQDLYLTKLKRETFPSDVYMWDIGTDQILYLKQLFAICEQLGFGKVEDYFHLVYGFINLKGGQKMSSRKGNVVSADDLLVEVITKAKKYNENEQVAQIVALGAIKYGFLKLARTSTIEFDLNESLSLDGNSGPYIQYTFARTQSVLNRVDTKNQVASQYQGSIDSEELTLLKQLIKFPEVISFAARSYAPNLVCNYLYELAQNYNSFYNKHKILGSDKEGFRLKLTSATGQVLKNGLYLLGIEAPEKM